MKRLSVVWAKMVSTFNKLSLVKQAGVFGGIIGLLGILVVKLAEYTSSLNQAMASLERLSSKEFTKKSASNKILWSCEVTFV